MYLCENKCFHKTNYEFVLPDTQIIFLINIKVKHISKLIKYRITIFENNKLRIQNRTDHIHVLRVRDEEK